MEYIEKYEGYKLTPGVLYHFTQPGIGKENDWARLVIFNESGVGNGCIHLFGPHDVFTKSYPSLTPSTPWVIREATSSEIADFEHSMKLGYWEEITTKIDYLDIF